MEGVNRFLTWKQTRKGLVISGVAEVILFYVFASLAVDSGSIWHYILAAIFLVGAIVSVTKAIHYRGKQ